MKTSESWEGLWCMWQARERVWGHAYSMTEDRVLQHSMTEDRVLQRRRVTVHTIVTLTTMTTVPNERNKPSAPARESVRPGVCTPNCVPQTGGCIA